MPAKSILFVDDDSQDMRRVFKELLEAAGFAVDTAENGHIAWSMIQVDSYDLILSDVDMPELSGIALATRVHSARPDLPIILITGRAYKALDEVTALVSQGIVKRVIQKPVQMDAVVEIVRKMIL